MEQGSNRTIAKNTLMLYARAVLMMLIGLYTSRVILQALGITDFGIYNAVGGVVGMLGFISSSLSNATSRFITIAIGRGDQEYTNRTFGNLKIIYYGLCVIVLLLAETIGLWFLFYQMSIPPERLDAAFWVFQYSVLSTLLNFICIPFNAAIIAHERMSAFAYMSLLDAILKLAVCYLLWVVPFDKLIAYSTFIFGVGIIDRVIYAVYCRSRFEEVKARPKLYKAQFQEILKISGWSMSGNIAWILNTQGINLLLNVFFGPVVNAARGIALQVQGVMGQFVTNFQTAVNPQITKNYGSGDLDRMHELLHLSSKFSYFIMLTMSIPLFIEAPVILNWWLGIVPDNTVVYLRIILVYSLLTTLSNPLWIAVLATGKLKKYQIYDNTIQLLVIPVSYMLFSFYHLPSYWIFLVLLIAEILEIGVRIWITLPLIGHQYNVYLKQVILPLIIVSCLSPILPVAFVAWFGQTALGVIISCLLSVISILLVIFSVGMNNKERSYILNKIRTR